MTIIIQALKECEEKEPAINDDVEALQAQLAAQEHLFQVLHFMTLKPHLFALLSTLSWGLATFHGKYQFIIDNVNYKFR